MTFTVKSIALPHRVRLLILWGTRDAFCRRQDEDELLGAIPGARLLAYEGAGHALHWEEPARFAADLVDFVEPLPRGRG